MKKRVKKVIMAAVVLGTGLLLWISCIPSGETGAYFMLGPYGEEPSTYYEIYFPNEDSRLFSYSEETGAYFMPGIFGRWIGGRFIPKLPDWDSLIPSSGEETGEDLRIRLSYEEEEEILDELTEFCNMHREKLNEMSEYFINELESISDYELEGISDYDDRKKLPDIEELAGAFTDEESREILEKLDPYYPYGIDCSSRLKRVSYVYHCDDYNEEEYVIPKFRVVYIKEDEEKVMRMLDTSSYCGPFDWTTRKIDKYLYAVMERWHLV